MRGRVGDLVAVRRPHSPEIAAVPREEVHGCRLEAVVVRAGVPGAGQGGAGDPFVLAVLAPAVDRPEGGGGWDGRRAAHGQGECYHETDPPSHISAVRPEQRRAGRPRAVASVPSPPPPWTSGNTGWPLRWPAPSPGGDEPRGPGDLAPIVFALLLLEDDPHVTDLLVDVVALTVGLSVVLHGATAAWAAGRYAS